MTRVADYSIAASRPRSWPAAPAPNVIVVAPVLLAGDISDLPLGRDVRVVVSGSCDLRVWLLRRTGMPLREPADGRLPRQMPEPGRKAVRIGQRHERDPRQRAGNVRVMIDAIF